LPRHPSQLYEAFAEGLLLSAVLWTLDRVLRARGIDRPGLIAGTFLIGYAIIRFALEFTRQPDAQLGFVLGSLSMGQLLSMIMFVAGLVFVGVAARSSAAGVKPTPQI
jgi:phosphatidylglycerol:prolipoprotein diacylglycerol transferase